MSSSHLFLSYSRADNVTPVNSLGHGWVTAFCEALKQRHKIYSGRDLQIFFDKESIAAGADWRLRLGDGLRQARLFLAFLSPNYITSENCIWEWEEYLRREHSAARGDDGLTPIFFITPDDLAFEQDKDLADWLKAMEGKYPWFQANPQKVLPLPDRWKPLAADLSRRNHTPMLELHPWFHRGDEALKELDAALRSAEVTRQAASTEPPSPAQTPSLNERLNRLTRHIAQRLDRLALADLAPGNLARGHEHFVGRHRELRELHAIMLTGGPQSGGRGMGGRGMIAATFAPGGLGKTALARQYAHAYAEFYAAGGTWEVSCEGAEHLGSVLLRLAEDTDFLKACELDFNTFNQTSDLLANRLELSKEDKDDLGRATKKILAYLHGVTIGRRDHLLEIFSTKAAEGKAERHTPDSEPPELKQPRALLILDNVDNPELLDANQRALLPAKDWLEIIVTTRLDPGQFGGGEKIFAHLEVGTLPDADAFRLLADFQPQQRFASEEEEEAARQIVRILGGWTLALEIAGAYMGGGQPESPCAFLDKLQKSGLNWIDDLTGELVVSQEIRHSNEAQENRLGQLIYWSIEQLSAPARTALEFASLLQPDTIPLDWLYQLTLARHPEIANNDLANKMRWSSVWRQLNGIRLLHPAGEIEVDDRGVAQMPQLVRIHRLVATHVQKGRPEAPQASEAPTPTPAIDCVLASHLRELEQFLYSISCRFEHMDGEADEAELKDQYPWLRDHLTFYISRHLPTSSILKSALVVAQHERIHGSLSQAKNLAECVHAHSKGFLGNSRFSPEDHRVFAVSCQELGDCYSEQGDKEKAIELFQCAMDILSSIWQSRNCSIQIESDLILIASKLATLLSSRRVENDLEIAFELLENSFNIAQAHFKDNPESPQAVLDLADAYQNLSDFLSKHGGQDSAQDAIELLTSAVELLQLLNEKKTSNRAKSYLAVCYSKLGALLERRGKEEDIQIAREFFMESTSLLKFIHESDPNSAQAANNLAASYMQTGMFLRKYTIDADLHTSHRYFLRALTLLKSICKNKQGSTEATSALATAYDTLGDFYLNSGNKKKHLKALRCFQNSLILHERNYLSCATYVEYGENLLISLQRISNLLLQIPGREGDSLVYCLRAADLSLEICKKYNMCTSIGLTAVVLCWRASCNASLFGNHESATHYAMETFFVLSDLAKREVHFDEFMTKIYNDLRPIFGNS